MDNNQIRASLKARREKRRKAARELEVGLAQEHGYMLAQNILSPLGQADFESGGVPAIDARPDRAEQYAVARDNAMQTASAQGNEMLTFLDIIA